MHRNTPVQDMGILPAIVLFGRALKDRLPSLSDNPERPQWKELRELRERAMAKCHARNAEHYNIHTRTLSPLAVGDSVLVQNQTGNHLKRWEKTGRVVEALDNWQFRIKVDGSNCVTLRNCCFLKRISPIADIHPTTPSYPQLLYTPSMLLPPRHCKPSFDVCQQVPSTKDPEAHTTAICHSCKSGTKPARTHATTGDTSNTNNAVSTHSTKRCHPRACNIPNTNSRRRITSQ